MGPLMLIASVALAVQSSLMEASLENDLPFIYNTGKTCCLTCSEDRNIPDHDATPFLEKFTVKEARGGQGGTQDQEVLKACPYCSQKLQVCWCGSLGVSRPMDLGLWSARPSLPPAFHLFPETWAF